jgi:alpha-tubulin suppressor-like RCC1 family protein
MRPGRLLALTVIVATCGAADCRLDPSPSCSIRTDRAEVPDSGVVITGGLSDLSLGLRHACVMVNDRDARCWGANDLSQLTTRGEVQPGQGWWYDDWRGRARMTAGGAHTCALNDEAVHCWGNNDAGQLGDGTADPLPGIVLVETTLDHDRIVDGVDHRLIAAGLVHTCAVGNPPPGHSAVACWGDNRHGQLGRRPSEGPEAPSIVEGLPSMPVRALVAGAFHTCAVVDGEETAELWCWGDARYGAVPMPLDPGDPSMTWAPPTRVEVGGALAQLSAGAHHNCVIVSESIGGSDGGTGGGVGSLAGDSWVECWGRGESGELGDGRGESSVAPVRVDIELELGASRDGEPPPGVFQPPRLRAGGGGSLRAAEEGLEALDGVGRTCLVTGGRAYCWGDNGEGQIGDGTTEDALTPVEVASIDSALPWWVVVPGREHTCGFTHEPAHASLATRDLYCWGANDRGQIGRAGDGSTVPLRSTVLEE